MGEKYELQWDSFPNHTVEIFNNLYQDCQFADVTLVSDDQIQMPAHKVVLSACSPVFRDLLVNNPHPNPLLYLRGIKQTELQAILQFMYCGKTQVFENRINEFISVGKDLQIKEIIKGSETHEENNEKANMVDKVAETLEGLNPTGTTRRKSDEENGEIVETTGGNVSAQLQHKCGQCSKGYNTKSALGLHKRKKHAEIRKYPCPACKYEASSLVN